MFKNILLSIFVSVVFLSQITQASLSGGGDADRETHEKPAQTNNRVMSSDHLICFKCETGRYPETVKEIIQFVPASEDCKPLFSGKKFISNQSGFNEFKITIESSKDGVMFLMSKEGFGSKDIWGAKAFFTTAVDKNSFMCGM